MCDPKDTTYSLDLFFLTNNLAKYFFIFLAFQFSKELEKPEMPEFSTEQKLWLNTDAANEIETHLPINKVTSDFSV